MHAHAGVGLAWPCWNLADENREAQNESLARADELMRSRRVRHILAVDEDGALRGVLSQRDIFHGGLMKALGFGTRARQQALDSLRVKDAMTSDPVTTAPEVEIGAAARVMVERKIGCLPVLEGDRLVGILTESDFARIVAGLRRPEKAP
jgi:CBS domain-containing membrane protein